MLELLWIVKPFLPEALYNFLLGKILTEFWAVSSKEEKISPELLRTSERGVLLEAIFKGNPVKKILEVGSGYGQNFWFLRRLLPKIPLVGVERDSSLFNEGKQTANSLQLKNIEFIQADSSTKLPFADNFFDLTYTCAALLYTSAEDIEVTISELIRVTKSRIILVEQHKVDNGYSEQHLGIWVSKPGGATGGYWLRDYEKLLRKFSKIEAISVKTVPNPRFSGESWKETANLIEAKLK